MKLKFIFVFFVLLTLSSCSTKKDFNQFLSEQDRGFEYVKANNKNYKSSTPFISGSQEDILGQQKTKREKSFFLSSNSTDKETENLLKSARKPVNQLAAGSFGHTENYMTYGNSALVKKLKNKGNQTFGFVYFKDSYVYDDPSNNFVRTFETSTDSIKGGVLQLQFQKIITKGWLSFAWGINAGVGYNNGRGLFLDGEQTESETKFTLWTLPLDFSLALSLPITSWVKLSVYGGPSAMGLIQNRDDRDQKDPKKQRRQVSYGHFYGAKFHFSLTNIFKKTALHLYDQFDVTQYFVTFDARVHEYQNFQDVLAISGTSFGVGFTFEYL